MGRPTFVRVTVPRGVKRLSMKARRKSNFRRIAHQKNMKDVGHLQTRGVPENAKPVRLSPRCTLFQRGLRNYRTPEKSHSNGPAPPTSPKEFRLSYKLRSRQVVVPRSPLLAIRSSHAMLKTSPVTSRFAQTLRSYPAESTGSSK